MHQDIVVIILLFVFFYLVLVVHILYLILIEHLDNHYLLLVYVNSQQVLHLIVYH